ncbi:hypothetical protein [Sorangium sp. So ce1078]|uniref:hypothetical protein n=1 Tax=Sorangium sp. So ce1078 TaxID=3133329 RepID=UPI003F62183D
MGTTKQDENTTPRVSPNQLQLDPGLKGWRHYIFYWDNHMKIADVAATRTASGVYSAGREYWFVHRPNLTLQSTLCIKGRDMEWPEPVPSFQASVQEFTSLTSATWQLVGADLTTGTLYKHATEDCYVRIAATGTTQDKIVTLLRWYRKSTAPPSSSFDPSGTYAEVPSLGSGTVWYADSKSP